MTYKNTNPRRFAGASISLLLALAFVALAFAPVTQPARAETDWNIIGGGALLGAGSGALIGGAIADGPGAVAGAVVGGVWGAIAGWFAQDKGKAGGNSAGDPNAINLYAKNLKNITEDYLGQAHASALGDIANYEAMSLYYARKAEWAALQLYQEQDAAGTAHTYDPHYVATKGEVANGTMAALWKIAAQYEAILNSNKDLASSFVGTYSGMEWGYTNAAWAKKATSTMSSNNPLIVKVGIYYSVPVNPNPAYWDSQYITVSSGYPLYAINIDDEPASVEFVVQDRSGTDVISFTGANKLNIPVGEAKLFNVPVSGEYRMKTDVLGVITVFGLLSPPLSGNPYYGPAIHAFAEGAGGTIKAFTTASGLYFGSTSDPDKRLSLQIIMDDINAMLPKIATMNAQANSFAQAYYNTLVSQGGGDNRVPPDIIFPDPDVLKDMDPEELYAIYLLYLKQAQQWFANYSVQSPSSVNISVESLKLKVRGSIYYANGTLAYANTTIFTPYVSLQGMHLTIGRNTMTQPGFAVIWGNASSLAGFDRFTDMAYHSLAVGDYFIIEEMTLDGVPITETDLTVHTVEYYIYDQYNPITPPQNPTDLEYLLAHWYWFAVIIGAIFLLAWIPTRNPAIGIIGLILLVAGLGFWLYSDWKNAGGLLSGLFHSIRGRL